MNFLQNIIRSGLQAEDEYQNRRGIILSNYISITLCAALILLYINRLVFYGLNMLETLLVGVPVLIIPVLCNRLHYTLLSRLLLCIAPVFFVWYAMRIQMRDVESIDQSAYDGLRIFLLSVCFIPYLLFDRNKLFILILGILPTLLSFLFFNTILKLIGLSPEQFGSVDSQLMPIRALIAYIIISIGCFIFQSIINRNDLFNKRLLAELKNRAEEIETQNEMLIESRAKLLDINQNLELIVHEKTKSIQKQNEVLLNYSYTNAHKVRGPVARILGLIQLSKIKTDLNYPWFFEKVEDETHQIDEIIRRISKDLDDANRTEET
jgi:signal transduction histidine kinase